MSTEKENILRKIDMLEKKREENINKYILPIEGKLEKLREQLFTKKK